MANLFSIHQAAGFWHLPETCRRCHLYGRFGHCDNLSKLQNLAPARVMPYVETMQEKSCLTCETQFVCGKSTNPDALCWCFEYPAVMPMERETGCYCPDCLKSLIQERIQAFCAAVTPETALTCGAQQYARKGPLIEDLDYTLDPNGNFVLSAWYLLKRGHCCKNGCRHCPYGYRKGA